LSGFGLSQQKLPAFTELVRDSGFLDLIPGTAASAALQQGSGEPEPWWGQSWIVRIGNGNFRVIG
jgi:hypothetical protein